MFYECFLFLRTYYYCQSLKEEFRLARKSIMSDRLKVEIAKELGFYDTVEREGWGGIKARDAGNMVKKAIEMAERQQTAGNSQK
ncbi:small, acid-soluble spore protein, alpha/beta type [Rummeliibacillus suwonensis]|nr:small, acid-soluble spore protein, alpha/beta type [Rummeliibacillus suwonensis]